MREIAARDAKNRFGKLLDAAQKGPVRVTRKGRAAGVVMSVQHYERLRGAAWERLTAAMDALGDEASTNGLTEASLEALSREAIAGVGCGELRRCVASPHADDGRCRR